MLDIVNSREGVNDVGGAHVPLSSAGELSEGANPASKGGCLFCGTRLRHTFVDLGMSPLCESYVEKEGLNYMERFYPLHVYVCEKCFLVQLEEYVSAESIFTEYAYFSSYADSWVE